VVVGVEHDRDETPRLEAEAALRQDDPRGRLVSVEGAAEHPLDRHQRLFGSEQRGHGGRENSPAETIARVIVPKLPNRAATVAELAMVG
jgi:hypothetical protein